MEGRLSQLAHIQLNFSMALLLAWWQRSELSLRNNISFFLRATIRITNLPGCIATAASLVIAPLGMVSWQPCYPKAMSNRC
jgi:hypothetical protein